jgi:hypothetical protein
MRLAYIDFRVYSVAYITTNQEELSQNVPTDISNANALGEGLPMMKKMVMG